MSAWASQLEAPEELVGALLDGLPTVIAVKDLEGRYLIVNQAWADIHGVQRERVLGRTDAEVFGTDDIVRLCAPDDELDGRETIQTIDVDGEERVFASRSYRLR